MRPTLLNFRSPNERTPEFYNPQTTTNGEPLNFRIRAFNARDSNFN